MRRGGAGILVVILALGVSLSGGGVVGVAEGQTADPVQLIASAAIVPFFSGGSVFTVFEVYSLGENPDMHAFFFDANCNRVFSLPFRMSAHDVVISDTIETGANFNGLLALTKSENSITAEALQSAITVRAHRADLLADTLWTVDPIGAAHAEDPTRTWNPLRSAAQTVTFPDIAAIGQTTRWWFICPRNHVTVDVGPGIPPFPPGPTQLRARAYDLDEEPIFDFQVNCSCLTEVAPNSLFPVLFSQARLVELVSYVNEQPIANPPAFVGYRVLKFSVGTFTEDSFGRMPGMSAATVLSGAPFQNAR